MRTTRFWNNLHPLRLTKR